jgi:FeS assembly SUF system protein
MSENREELMRNVLTVIKSIFDPEIPVNIWDLGLIYDIQITEENDVVVLMTLTAPNCPEAEGIPVEVEQKLKMIPGVNQTKVILTFEPPWDKDRLTDEAKLELGLF